MATILVTNATPGGPVSPEADYRPPAVRFAAGAYIGLPGTSTSNSNKITLSGWYKVDELPTNKWTALHYFNRIGVDGPNPSGLVLSYLGTLELTLQSPDALPVLVTVRNTDAEDPFMFGSWNHIFISVDLNAADEAKTIISRLNGGSTNLFYLSTELDTSSGAFNVNLTTSDEGSIVGRLPGDGSYFNNPATFVSVPIEVCNLMVWHDKAVNPDTTLAEIYSAKSGSSYVIRKCVEYMNGRKVNPLHALTVMNIESVYGTLSRNLYQFVAGQQAYDDILDYIGVLTNAEDQHRAFANTWSGNRPNDGSGDDGFDGSAVPTYENRERIVRIITGTAPLPYQKFIIHNLGGSTRTVPHVGQVNGYSLLLAWVQNPSLTLGQVGTSITNMLAQSKIYGSSFAGAPGVALTTSSTVQQAIDRMISVWNTHEADALTHLDGGGTRSNLGQFIDSDGFPVPTAVAAEKFGNPTFRLEGTAEEFVINFGTGGDVTVSGSITDAEYGPRV